MKKNLFLIFLTASASFLSGQEITISNPTVIPLKLIGLSKPLKDIPEEPDDEKMYKTHENESLEKRMKPINPNALPIGADPALQKNYSGFGKTSSATVNILANWVGLKTAIYPSDNTIAVGPNHVMQMTNGSTSSVIRIWDKAGTVLVSSKTAYSITGIADYGDPNVIYDELADRWVFTQLGGVGKSIIVSVSQTNDPTGAWYTYSFITANGYPDYEKIGVWGNSYFITSNSNSPTIFALDRTSMLAGSGTGTVQNFNLSIFPQIGFQSASPVSFTGSIPAPSAVQAVMIRVADDAWSSTLAPDHLQIFKLAIDWVTPSNSKITGPTKLPTIAYNSDLCGFGSWGCIPQPGSTTLLDPLSDIIMDKAQYRNLGNYESIVCTHVCNADGNGTAGIRWYELWRDTTANAWAIHQQGTYSPDTTYRFMSTISINREGSIALGYNVSSKAVYPGIRLTGRDTCDPLNMMSVTEAIIKNGTKANNVQRYGDYNGMVADPSDNSFWFTANYNTSGTWSTNVVHFDFNICNPMNVEKFSIENLDVKIVPNPSDGNFDIIFPSEKNTDLNLGIFDVLGKSVFSEKMKTVSGENKIRIENKNFAKGIYILEMDNGQKKNSKENYRPGIVLNFVLQFGFRQLTD